MWKHSGITWESGPLPRIMGILNVTPDSFSDGGSYQDVGRAVEHGRRLMEEGAEIIDVGGESTRPGAEPVSERDELRRVIPVIEGLRASGIRTAISIDTMKSRVAEEALAAGAVIVNDVSGLESDPRMVEVCAGSDCGVIIMHMRGTPQTMQRDPQYADVVRDVGDYLEARVEWLRASGIAPERVVLDPGIGFGKTAWHNFQLLSRTRELRRMGRPLLVGHSRKSFLKQILHREVDARSSGTIGVSLALAEQGVEWLRVHEPQAVGDALLAWHYLRSGQLSG